ncbi:hypothetical protein C8R45DRAFT_1082571 [Mycena sanguinolenta]|nr:hypothetical protein C8R45DRAFT_1082571 [Mycena sanguinolenta]
MGSNSLATNRNRCSASAFLSSFSSSLLLRPSLIFSAFYSAMNILNAHSQTRHYPSALILEHPSSITMPVPQSHPLSYASAAQQISASPPRPSISVFLLARNPRVSSFPYIRRTPAHSILTEACLHLIGPHARAPRALASCCDANHPCLGGGPVWTMKTWAAAAPTGWDSRSSRGAAYWAVSLRRVLTSDVFQASSLTIGIAPRSGRRIFCLSVPSVESTEFHDRLAPLPVSALFDIDSICAFPWLFPVLQVCVRISRRTGADSTSRCCASQLFV